MLSFLKRHIIRSRKGAPAPPFRVNSAVSGTAGAVGFARLVGLGLLSRGLSWRLRGFWGGVKGGGWWKEGKPASRRAIEGHGEASSMGANCQAKLLVL